MNVRSVGSVMAFLILLSTLATLRTEAGRRAPDTFLTNRLVAIEISEEKSKKMWMHCMNELKKIKDLKEKEQLFCFRNKNIINHNTPKEHLPTRWFPKQHDFLKRHEGKNKPSPALSPNYVPIPSSYSHAPFSNGVISPNPPNSNTPVKVPPLALAAPVRSRGPARAQVPIAMFPKPARVPISWLPKPYEVVFPPPMRKYDAEENSVDGVFVGSVIGGALLIVVALLLFYWLMSLKIGRSDGNNDGRPLLKLSFSDFPGGSSKHSFSIGSFSSIDLRINPNNLSKTPSTVISDSETFSLPEPAATTTELPKNKEVPLSSLNPPHDRSPAGQPQPPPAPNPPPPPPPTAARASPLPPKSKLPLPSRLGPQCKAVSEGGELGSTNKAKLKPFFWDKVPAKADQAMVWNEISAGSFQFNEEMMETLFGYPAVDKNKIERRKEPASFEAGVQFIHLIDPKKAQNLLILLRALNVTIEEVRDALQEGNELPIEFLQTMLKMAPTPEEELKLRLFSGEFSRLGPAERFLKQLVDFIPLAFKRMEILIFMTTLLEDVSIAKDSLATLEVACKELRSSRLFLKLLEAVLKTGNRMNDGTFRGGAQAFKLETLLKLSDVKGTNGKTTLLHFVVEEIMRSEGRRALRSSLKQTSDESCRESEDQLRSLGLQVVSGLSEELENVKRASVIDYEELAGTISKIGNSLLKAKEFLKAEIENEDERSQFYCRLGEFLEKAEAEITSLLESERAMLSLVKSTADYFHGNAGKDEGMRLFMIVRDFLVMLDRTCKEVRNSAMALGIRTAKKESVEVSSTSSNQMVIEDVRQRLFPAIAKQRMDSSSGSDDENER